MDPIQILANVQKKLKLKRSPLTNIRPRPSALAGRHLAGRLAGRRPAALARGLRASRAACAPPARYPASPARWCAAHHCREGEREREIEKFGGGCVRERDKLGKGKIW